MTVHARVLGIAQDAGVPHPGCACPRCERHRAAPLLPACLGLVGARSWMIDATPAFAEQLRGLPAFPSGLVLTHLHLGHAAGLLQLGPEACATEGLPVFASPAVCAFLRENGPWELLVRRGHVELREWTAMHPLEDGLAVEPVPVPHRNEYGDTVAVLVHGPAQRVLYLPDIDAWDGFDLSALLARCDVALLDGTFLTADELPRQTRVPHPPIETTWARLTPAERAKVRFLHLNHTNPVLDAGGPVFPLAAQGARLPL